MKTLRLENIVKLIVPVAASFTMACCGTIDSAHQEIPQAPEPLVIADSGVDADTSKTEQISDAALDVELDAVPEDLPFYDEKGCPCISKEPGIERDDYLLRLYKFNPYYKQYRNLKVDGKLVVSLVRELPCFGLEDIPEHIIRHYKRYARKGLPVPTYKQMAEKAALKAARKSARTIEERVETPESRNLPAREADSKIAPVVIRYSTESWRLGKNDVTKINSYVEKHRRAKCFTIEGYADEDTKFAKEKAQGIRTYLSSVYGLKAKVRVRYSGTGSRRAVIQAECR